MPIAVVAVIAALFLASPAAAAVVEIEARGNVFLGGLEFFPRDSLAEVGDTVRWRNVDLLVPHTSTEVHELWELTGSYGGTPANPPGYPPGARVERVFEAGTHQYFCRVHPEPMRATVGVPVRLAIQTRRVRRRVRGRVRTTRARVVRATWAAGPPADGLAFDVERRLHPGPWRALGTGTRSRSATFSAGQRGAVHQVRARLRSATDGARATDWSPLAQIRNGSVG